jgi:hypothetical protein
VIEYTELPTLDWFFTPAAAVCAEVLSVTYLAVSAKGSVLYVDD